MLTELRIQNFAIIDQLELEFGPHLITFTGETGAGKSIIIDAVGTLLGSRVDDMLIRTHADRALIEGVFQIDPAVQPSIHDILQRENLLDDPKFLTLGREIRREGRNIARVNGRSVTVSLLRELGEYLVDIHGQSEHLSLLRVAQHLGLLDRYADCHNLLASYRKTYHELITVRRKIQALKEAQREAQRRVDLLGYQINEIDAAHLQPGEEEELVAERNRLANAENLASFSQKALMALDESTPDSSAATDLVGQAVQDLLALSQLDPSKKGLADQAQSILELLTDLAHELRTYADTIEFNPKRLEQVEERLNLIHTLKRKYGDTIQQVLDFADQVREELDSITNSEERLADLQAKEQLLLNKLSERGQALSEKRRTAAVHLSQSIEEELSDLRMKGTRFGVRLHASSDPNGVLIHDGRRVAFDANGLEKVEFLVAPNVGEELKPLVKIASGGETSRLMLAMKHVLVKADQTPTLIFDEIDQGIGGRIGTIVGYKLWKLARQHQVLCVTHLPQLAAFGDQHFRVEKHTQQGRTTTRVELLSGENRILELAQMLGEISEGTLRSAHELLQNVMAQTASFESTWRS
jgi:DNA repair protein RecN (Recombination protein N)